MLISVSPKKQYGLWVSINLSLVLILLGLEYTYPSLIVDNYPSELTRFIDTASAYLIIVVLVFAGMTSIRRKYYKEKKAVLGKTHQLERLNSEKNKLFSIISHDLKTPLSMVHQYLELLNVFDLEPEEKEEIEAGLLRATRNTQDLLSNLLAWSNNQMEGIRVNLRGLNLKNSLTKTLNTLQMIAAQKQQNLQVNISSEIDVWADKDMLQLVIRNLVSNAIKFTPNGGEIRVFTQIDNKNCIFVVQDNGVGIDMDRQKALFSLKLRSSFGTQNEKGIGLGLLLCKEYTEMQNGKIWFKSELGQGTSFYVSLPIFVYRELMGVKSEAAASVLW
ncbi:MAG TPA: HAMP domain-containing sensor histidine kinase [Daejeonella sp.]|nr:HAMP domain-containing sensor histidine kinase [Daejeonella sp.]